MHIRDLFKVMFHAFFIITTGITASMYVLCLIFTPNASLSPVDIGRILLVAFTSDLTFFIFLSHKELNRKQMLLRFSIHIPVLVAMLLYFAYLFDWVNMRSPAQIAVFILLVSGVYASVLAITSYHDKKTAEKLNLILRERYHS